MLVTDAALGLIFPAVPWLEPVSKASSKRELPLVLFLPQGARSKGIPP